LQTEKNSDTVTETIY